MVEVIPASKSEMIRAMTIKSWKPHLAVLGESQAEDVVNFSAAIQSFLNGGTSFYLGDSALGLRCLLSRLSREVGEFELKANKRLFERPHDELIQALLLLGAKIKKKTDTLILKSNGWRLSEKPLHLSLSQSSQYATSLLLNAWELEKPLTLELDGSSHYLQLTLEFLKQSGMYFKLSDHSITVPPHQKISASELQIGPDMSTAFTMAAWRAVQKGGRLLNFPTHSLQPDFAFLELLKSMGIKTNLNNGLEVTKAPNLQSIEVNVSHAPDLFPVLTALCALANGASIIIGGKALQWKESNRLKMATVFLEMLSRKHELLSDGIIIYGKPFSEYEARRSRVFDPNQDHRWVMAAQTARLAGFNIKILNPEAIKKTAPELLSEVVL